MQHWRDFMHRLDRFWNRLNAHFKKSPKWEGWSAPYKQVVRSDPLLRYLSQSRDADHHTIESDVIEVVGGTLTVGEGGHVHLQHVAKDTWQVSSTTPHRIEFDPSKLQLRPAVSRGVTYAVPTQHLGNPIDTSNVGQLAALALNYYGNLLSAAEESLCK